MRSYDEIFAIAADRKGGAAALEDLIVGGPYPIPTPETPPTELPEDRWLSAMTRGVFQAGFNWSVIDAKWDGFEAAFKGFDVDRCAMMSEDWFDQLITDTRIVRNGTKIQSVRANAVFVTELRAEGGVGAVIGGWPSRDFVGLLARLKTDGSRLGGTTAQYMLRSLGVDTFLLSTDVVARLVAEGVIDKPPTSKKAMAAVQTAFNTWADQSGRSMAQISRTLSMSV
ncbi:DNA-3-methyladenine glycosylase I [Actibacterium sp. 188UL27-1]|uniref:DNA-3-methyladenine glycosylase I n=1 Tax=Actibacterium sp. 188UL27-1 TaxID=2786961 RepID=UPI00195DF2F2|nr:DNA-3-methyladenine glycosylase I [Actibacterium sp. 188UL27-1]MBM7069544.1 DNA-3-methyladenine glycosylase I [Actibacterium sp. 188UL27-1]